MNNDRYFLDLFDVLFDVRDVIKVAHRFISLILREWREIGGEVRFARRFSPRYDIVERNSILRRDRYVNGLALL